MMKLKTLLNKTKNLSLSKLSLIIVYTVLVIFVTLTVNLGNNSEFINITLPTWLTALGTIGAVFAAVGQMVWFNYQKQQEEKARSVNARIFIDSMLTDYKVQFNNYSQFKYHSSDFNDIIDDGNLKDLYELFFQYLDSDIRETTTEYINDLKFGIENIGVQTDSHTIESISERFKAVKNIKVSVDNLSNSYKDVADGTGSRPNTDMFVFITRKEMKKIDESLQILIKDLTDKDEK